MSSPDVESKFHSADMVEIEDARRSSGDLKEEEIADTVERKLQEEDEEEMAGSKLLEPGGFGLEQVLAGTQHSDKFGERELEQLHSVKEEEEEDDDDDEFDGPPPGWGSALPASSPLAPSFDREREQQLKRVRRELDVEDIHEQNEVEEMREKRKEEDEEQLEDDDDELEGPPPGWGSTLQLPHSPFSTNPSLSFHPSSDHDKVKEDDDDDDDDDQMDGPPPGWASPSWQLRPSSTPPHGQSSNLLPPTKRSHVFCKSCLRHLSYPQGAVQVRCSKCQIVIQVVEERAQMVCGFCRRLLSYPQGSRFIQCSLCKQLNYVLQEHEVGHVKCENCTELLMYPSGAPSVRCTKCHFVTDIGEHNRRPLLSVQQGRDSLTTLTH